MTDRIAPTAAVIEDHMQHVSNAADAITVGNELRQAVGSMSGPDALAFVRQINRDMQGHNVPEQINVLTDMTSAAIELNNPFTGRERINLHSAFRPAADNRVDQPVKAVPEDTARDMDKVRNSGDANRVLDEMQQALNGMDLHDTIAISFNSPYAPDFRATLIDDHNAGHATPWTGGK